MILDLHYMQFALKGIVHPKI